MTVILTDCDGVLLNWRDPFDFWMMQEQGIFPEGDTRVYDQVERYNIEKDRMKRYVRDFNGSANIGYLPPLYDSVKYVKKLYEEHGYTFICITSLSLNKYAHRLREENLKKIFGDTVFDEFVFLDTGADKDEALEYFAKLYPGAFWLEDKVENAKCGKKFGLESLLIKHIHLKTEDTDGIPVMASWKEVYDTITGQ